MLVWLFLICFISLTNSNIIRHNIVTYDILQYCVEPHINMQFFVGYTIKGNMIDITLHCFLFDQYSKLAAATPIFSGFLLIEKKEEIQFRESFIIAAENFGWYSCNLQSYCNFGRNEYNGINNISKLRSI